MCVCVCVCERERGGGGGGNKVSIGGKRRQKRVGRKILKEK